MPLIYFLLDFAHRRVLVLLWFIQLSIYFILDFMHWAQRFLLFRENRPKEDNHRECSAFFFSFDIFLLLKIYELFGINQCGKRILVKNGNMKMKRRWDKRYIHRIWDFYRARSAIIKKQSFQCNNLDSNWIGIIYWNGEICKWLC